jgi:thioredoxin-like negative regulator of GroEL
MKNHHIHAYLQSMLEDATEHGAHQAAHSGYRDYLQAQAYQMEDALPFEERNTRESVAMWLDFIDTGAPESIHNEVKTLREESQVNASFIKDLERLADLRKPREARNQEV